MTTVERAAASPTPGAISAPRRPVSPVVAPVAAADGVITAGALFDGARFVTDAEVTVRDGRVVAIATVEPGAPPVAGARHVPCLLPGLIDASVRFRGYRESPLEPPFGALEVVAALLARYGTVLAREAGNSREALAHAVDVLGVAGLVPAGPVLVSGAPRHEVDRAVPTAAAARAAVASVAHDSASWVTFGGALDEAAATAAAIEAARLGLAVAATAGASRPSVLADLGTRCLHGVHPLLFEHGGWRPDVTPAELALRWADEPSGRVESAVLPALVAAGSALAPELVAFRRMVLIREAIEAPGLDALLPVFPSTRWLLEMRRPGGFALGRRHLAGATGLVDLSRHERHRAELGLDRAAAFVRAAAGAGVAIVASSRSPGLGAVPGLGLAEELGALMAALDTDLATVLATATSTAAHVLGATGFGRIAVGSPACFAVAGQPAHSTTDVLPAIRGYSDD